MAKIVAIGELLIDFTPAGVSENGKNLYECNPGGGVPNVLSCLSSLGDETELIACVGEDAFGETLIRALKDAGIGHSHVKMIKNVPTTLAIVSLDARGERSFSFYRSGCADLKISSRSVTKALFRGARALCVGSLSTVADPSRAATYKAIECAKAAGAIVCFDPNWRPFLWKSAEDAIEQMKRLLTFADIVKVSEEELSLLTETEDLASGAKRLFTMSSAKVLFVTLGSEGSLWFTRGELRGAVRPERTDGVVDTTGAGDYFVGGALNAILKTGKAPEALTPDELTFACAAGNKCGWQVACGRGALGRKVTV